MMAVLPSGGRLIRVTASVVDAHATANAVARQAKNFELILISVLVLKIL
jgi:hypothetical protein